MLKLILAHIYVLLTLWKYVRTLLFSISFNLGIILGTKERDICDGADKSLSFIKEGDHSCLT